VRLNGWQRLWVLITVLWMIAVVSVSYLLWPVAGSIQNSDVYAQLKPEDSQRLYDRWAKYAVPPDFIPDPGKTVDIGGHTVQFAQGLSENDMNKTAAAYYAALQHILLVRRVEFGGEAIAAWSIPVAALYAIGWAVGWVRRGFQGATS
jgi:hypothetical protein